MKMTAEHKLDVFSKFFDSPNGSKAEALMQLAVMHPEVDAVYKFFWQHSQDGRDSLLPKNQ